MNSLIRLLLLLTFIPFPICLDGVGVNPTPAYVEDIEFEEEDIDVLARIVMSEASICKYETKVAVAKTAINRIRAKKGEFKNITIENVAKNDQFSTQNNGKVTMECYDAVFEAILDTSLPDDMYWFCKSKTSNYGYLYKTYDHRMSFYTKERK